MTLRWIDAVGWIGAVLLLVAYVLVSTRRLEGQAATFHGLNLLGGAGLAANSAVNGAFPSVALNVIWMAVGIVALVRRADRSDRVTSSPS
jgi:hypothetical protein